MAFLEELGKTLTDTGKEVATKAKAITESIQLKSQISAEKVKLEEAYGAIGKLYYEANLEPEEAFAKAFEAVKLCRERIAALEIELTQYEGSRICAECGAKVAKDSAFCSKCGAPVKEISKEEMPEESQETPCEEQSVVDEVIVEEAEEPAAQAGMNAAKEEEFVSLEEDI